MTLLYRIAEYILCIFFPARCIFCNEVIEPLQLCCDGCRGEISTIRPPVCPLCGCHEEDCECSGHHHAYDAVLAPFYYEKAVRHGILRLKKWDDPKAIAFFAAKMAAVLRREYPELPFDGIGYIPMTKRKMRQREYNQSRLLAKELAKAVKLPLSHALIKRYETKPQKGLGHAQRSGNVLGAFDVIETLPGERMLLVDDVITTGATAGECAKMLKLLGAKTVTVIGIAVTPPKREKEENEPAADT